jgi:DNA-binding NarL/FixJ family response regulator
MIVADSPLWISRIHELLGSHKNIRFTESALNGATAIHYAPFIRPDLIVMELRLPDVNGLEVAMDIRHQGLPSRIILLCAEERPDSSLVRACSCSGVHALITRAHVEVELLPEIRRLFGRILVAA